MMVALATVLAACGGKKSGEAAETSEATESATVAAVAAEDEKDVTLLGTLPTDKQKLLDDWMNCEVLGMDAPRVVEAESLEFYESIKYNCFDINGDGAAEAIIKTVNAGIEEYFLLVYSKEKGKYIQYNVKYEQTIDWGFTNGYFVTIDTAPMLSENTEKYTMFLTIDPAGKMDQAGEEVIYNNGDPVKKWPSAEVVDPILAQDITLLGDMQWATLVKTAN